MEGHLQASMEVWVDNNMCRLNMSFLRFCTLFMLTDSCGVLLHLIIRIDNDIYLRNFTPESSNFNTSWLLLFVFEFYRNKNITL